MNRPDGLPTGDAPRIEADSSTHEPGERTDTSRSPDPAAATTFARFLAEQRDKSQLRFITCGSVDDGKSTLLGRLLYDAQLVLDDQLSAAASESRTYGTQGGDVDLALLVDGLQAEREQGITIDVAYRYFETPKRKFIAADTPGHEQYTRNMATGASTADLAILLVDARHGVITQTRRHSFIVSLLGIRHIVLAVNKMDLVDYDQATFNAIDEAYRAFAGELGVEDVRSIPISALEGENITRSGSAMPWYAGPTLLSLLETIDVAADTDVADVTTSSTLGITDMTADQQAFRLPVQWVNRPDPSFRGFSGRIAAGAIQLGTTIRSSLTGRSSTLTRIVGPSGDLEEAVAVSVSPRLTSISSASTAV
ncbi:MAG: GTP-binding protein, partial [Pseudomonadota bacterium]